MLKKLDMVIPTELLGLSDIQIQAIYLRGNQDAYRLRGYPENTLILHEPYTEIMGSH